MLYLPNENGYTLADTLRQVEKSTGQRDTQLDSVYIPDEAFYVWQTFWAVNSNCSDSITYPDISSYCDLYEITLTSWELDMIIMLSSQLKSSIRKEQQKREATRKR